MIDKSTIGSESVIADAIHAVSPRRKRFGALAWRTVQDRCLERRCQRKLNILARQCWQRILIADDFALFGHLYLTINGTPWQRDQRIVCRTATTANRATTAMEESQRDAVFHRDIAKLPLCLMNFPLGCGDTGIFVRIRISQHHFLNIATQLYQLAVIRI